MTMICIIERYMSLIVLHVIIAEYLTHDLYLINANLSVLEIGEYQNILV